MNVKIEQAKVKVRRFAKKTLWVLLAASIILGTGYYFYRTYTISDGNRTGLLFKISRKGVVFKTFEGQLHLGGSIQMTNESVWNFSASSQAVYSKLQQFEGKNVSLHYRELVNPFPWQGDTKYIVDDVIPVTQ